MGKCANCGNKKLFLESLPCKVCGKEGCNKCFRFLFGIINEYGYLLDKWFTCSDKCLNELAIEIEGQISPNDVPADEWDQIPPIHSLTKRAILHQNSKRLVPEIAKQISKGRQLYVCFQEKPEPDPSFLSYLINGKEDRLRAPNNALWQRLFQYTSLLKAHHFETLREFENAAKVFKSLGMYAEAGRAREKRDEIRIKKTEVSVNLSSLLEQIKNGGIIAVYRCPHCGGKLKIDKNAKIDKLKVCEHCGSEIESMDLVDFLKTALS